VFVDEAAAKLAYVVLLAMGMGVDHGSLRLASRATIFIRCN
jgi:hypothetical protein